MSNTSAIRTAAILAILTAAATHAQAAGIVTLNLSTGLDGSGVTQTTSGANDANWTINSQPAKVVTTSSADWWGGWPADDAKSDWIAEDPNSNSDNGIGVYSRTFDLTGINLNTVDFSGKWAVDDEGTLSINGHQIGVYQPHDGWNNFATQTFDVTDPSIFNQGLNTISLTIAASDDFFEGVRLNGTLTASAAPEPASIAILAAALIPLLMRRRK